MGSSRLQLLHEVGIRHAQDATGNPHLPAVQSPYAVRVDVAGQFQNGISTTVISQRPWHPLS